MALEMLMLTDHILMRMIKEIQKKNVEAKAKKKFDITKEGNIKCKQMEQNEYKNERESMEQ